MVQSAHHSNIPSIKQQHQFSIVTRHNSNTKPGDWDETAVLVAMRGIAPYFNFRKLNFEIKDDGKNMVIPGEKFTYLTFKQTPEQVGKVIEDLMMHQPGKK